MKIIISFGIVLSVFISGCATPWMKINGVDHHQKKVKSVEELNNVVAEVSSKKKTDIEVKEKKDTAVARDVEGTVAGVTYFGASYLPGLGAVASLADSAGMGMLLFIDIVNLAGDLQLKKNKVIAKIQFDRPTELIRQRNHQDEKHWFRETIGPMIKEKAPVYGNCKEWGLGLLTGIIAKDKSMVYSVDDQNWSLLSDSVMIYVRYSDEDKKLPVDAPCSVKSAELYLADMVKSAQALTPEYVKK